MATLRKKTNLAAMNGKNIEDHPTKIQARNTNSPGVQQIFIAEVSGEIESRVPKNLSLEFNSTESRHQMSFFKIHNPEFAPEPFWRLLGLSLRRTRERTRTAPTTILIPRWEPFPSGIKPRRDILHGDSFPRRNPRLHPWDFFKETKEDALPKSAAIPQ